MAKAERIASAVFGGGFTEGDVELVGRVMRALSEDADRERRRTALPTRDVPLGGVVEVSGRRFRCVARPLVWPPSEACSGCDLSRLYLGCSDLRCSCFDRADGRFVWFRKEK